MSIHRPLLMAFDVNDEAIRLGDIVALVSDGRDYPGTVVSIFGPNIEIEFSSSHREQAFGVDVVRIS